MEKIKIIAGDFKQGYWLFSGKILSENKFFFPEKINLKTLLKAIDSIDKSNKKNLTGTAIAGIAGAALFGPLGAIGGMLLGGNKKDITFAAELTDGRKFLAITDVKTYSKLLAIAFNHGQKGNSNEDAIPEGG